MNTAQYNFNNTASSYSDQYCGMWYHNLLTTNEDVLTHTQEPAQGINGILSQIKAICTQEHVANTNAIFYSIINQPGIPTHRVNSKLISFEPIQSQALKRRTYEATNRLLRHREEIDKIDREIVVLLAKRFLVSRQVAEIKKTEQLNKMNLIRWRSLLSSLQSFGKELGLDSSLITAIWTHIHFQSLREQIKS